MYVLLGFIHLTLSLSLQWEGKVEDGQKNFEKASRTLKKEVERFEVRFIM